jgi:hypothetical protein
MVRQLCLAEVRTANLASPQSVVDRVANWLRSSINTGRNTPLEDWIGAKDAYLHDDIAHHDLCYVLNEGRLIEVQNMSGSWYGGTEVQGRSAHTTYRSSELIVWRVDGFVIKNLIRFVRLWRQKRADATERPLVVDMPTTVSDNVRVIGPSVS